MVMNKKMIVGILTMVFVVVLLGFTVYGALAADEKTKEEKLKDKIVEDYNKDLKKNITLDKVKVKKIDEKTNGIVQADISITQENGTEKTYTMITFNDLG